jgi:hypothetical protein
MSALSTPSSSSKQQQLFSHLLPASKCGDKKNKAKYKTRRETGKDNQRRKKEGKIQPNDQEPNKS